MRAPAAALLTFVASAAPAAAHDGHGAPQWWGTVVHWFGEPAHLPQVAAALALTLGVGLVVRKLRRRRRAASSRP